MDRELFPYQQELLDAGDAKRAQGYVHLLNVAPTGAGKTDVMCAKIKRDIEADLPCLVVADTIEIVDQIVARLVLYGIAAGTIMGGRPRHLHMNVQVGTRQSLTDRFFERHEDELPDFKRLHIDEAHGAGSPDFRRIFARFADIPRDGYTATPARKGGYGLGPIFDTIVMGPSVKALQELKRLVPTRAVAPLLTSLDGLRTRQGDYAEADLERRLNKPRIVGDVVTHWLRWAGGRLTLVYAVTVAHAIAIRDAFRTEGIKAEYVCGKTLPDERAAALAMLASGEITVLVNVGVLTKGFDCPPVSCIQVARPTKSLVLWLQIVGRGLRACEGKTDCLIIDHGGMIQKLGWPEDDFEWTLDADKSVINRTKEAAKKDGNGNTTIECAMCGPPVMRRVDRPCDACGFYPPPAKPKDVIIVNADLALVDRATKAAAPAQWSPEMRQAFYQMLLAIRREQGKSDGGAFYAYMEKFPDGPKPPYAWRQLPSVEPTAEVRRWEHHWRIKTAKRMEKEKATKEAKPTPPPKGRGLSMVTAAKVGRSCGCGGQFWTLEPPKGPHAEGLRCAACGRHGGWMPKAMSHLDAYHAGRRETPF